MFEITQINFFDHYHFRVVKTYLDDIYQMIVVFSLLRIYLQAQNLESFMQLTEI